MLLKLEPLRESSCKLCRSPQTSDSNELPPDSKTPTTFQMRLPTFRSAPNEQPGYRFKINLPTMTSFSPGATIRPAIMRTVSWVWVLTGSTPRMGRLSKVSPAGINTCSVSSGETSGFPAPSRLMAGRNLSASNWSSVINELVSESAPRPIRIMLSGELLSLIAESRPPTIAIPATKTPTTMAIAPTVIELDTRRMSRLRRLYLKGMAMLIHQSKGLSMLRLAAARAGTYALNKPISAATPRVSANTKGGTCNETKGPRASALNAKTLNSPNATPQPIAPPDKATINDSPTSRLKITPEGNPIERITAISPRRSRMDIAAVFAATSPIATTATRPRSSASFMKIR